MLPKKNTEVCLAKTLLGSSAASSQTTAHKHVPYMPGFEREKGKDTSFVFWLKSNVLSPRNMDQEKKKKKAVFFLTAKRQIQNITFNFLI